MNTNNDNIPKDYDSLLKLYTDLKTTTDAKTHVGAHFVERMKYDFNTLLNSVTGYMYTSLENAKPPLNHSIEGALKTTKVLLKKFDDMTDYLTLFLGSYERSLAPSSLRLIMRQVNQEFDEILTVKRLGFVYDIESSIHEYLETDYLAIKKALTCLVENAILHTQEGAVRVYATLEAETKETQTIKINVVDEGTGINEEKIAALLADENKSRFSAESSTGFGFQIAKDFLSVVDSKLVAQNNPKQGATFSFTLTASKINLSANNGAEDDFDHDDSARSLRGLKVLLTDDSVIMQQIVKQMLEAEGMQVTVAVNGSEAVEAFKNDKFDLILMDVEMPVLNGYEASKNITAQQLKQTIKTPIVGMTAHTDQEEYDKCFESGMSNILIKPFKHEGLVAAIFKELFHEEYVTQEQEVENKKSDIYKFESIKGINSVEGIKRLSGNEKLYFELLQKFRDGYSDSVENISTLLKEGNDGEVKNILHLIKGISGNLSFNEIYDYANKLREAVDHDNITEIAKYLRLFGEAINDFKQSFSTAEVEILYNMSEIMDMDLLLVKSRLDELLTYMSGDIDLGNAMDAADDIYDYMKETDNKKDFKRIRDSINSFDLELAQTLLKTFIAKFS